MYGMIEWFARNRVAADMLMIAIIVMGWLLIPITPKEIIPNLERDRISITSHMSGASPSQIEKSICAPIERAISSARNVARIRSSSTKNTCTVYADLDFGSEVRDALDDIENSIRYLSLPSAASEPKITQPKQEIMVSRLTVSGYVDYRDLIIAAEKVQNDLLDLGLNKVKMREFKKSHIYVEISESTLQQYQLSLAEVTQAVKEISMDVSAGAVNTADGSASVVISGKYTDIDALGDVVIRSFPDGGMIRLRDIATFEDGFSDTTLETRLNGKPAISISVFQDTNTDITDISDKVNGYLASSQSELPAGIELSLVQDNSAFFINRIRLLQDNAIMGLILVFGTLLLFLRLRLAFWVTAGIPIAFLGGFIVLFLTGSSINMVSTFGLLIVLGIVVDDAIIIGENIHKHQSLDPNNPQEGAVKGAIELAKPVIFAVLTTAITFVPLMFLPGAEGRLMSQLPIIVIGTLLFSLIECLLVLPAHLSHTRNTQQHSVLGFSFMQKLDTLIAEKYSPLLKRTLQWRYAAVTAFVSCLFICLTLVSSGWLNINFFSSIETEVGTGYVEFPKGDDYRNTLNAIHKMESAALELKEELFEEYGTEQILHVRTLVGNRANLGTIYVSLATSSDRKVDSDEVMDRWREKVGDIHNTIKLTFSTILETDASAYSIKLHSNNQEQLQAATDALKLHMQSYPGIINISDSMNNAHKEINVQLKPGAHEMGINIQQLSSQIKAAFAGTGLPSVERDGKQVSVSLRLPEEERNSIWHLENLPVRIKDGSILPLYSIADISYQNSPERIQHVDGKRVVFINAQIDDAIAKRGQVIRSINQNFLQTMKDNYPEVDWGPLGIAEAEKKIRDRLSISFIVSVVFMFMLMSMLFGSYFQPLMILSSVPFGIIGALAGHALFGHELTIWSMAGIVAVSGIVVNDNMVLVFYINEKLDEGKSLMEAVMKAGVDRFRPIFLTTITTFFGLAPMMLEGSWEAQFLIPMAISISFGILFATLISLFLVPALYIISNDVKQSIRSRLGLATTTPQEEM